MKNAFTLIELMIVIAIIAIISAIAIPNLMEANKRQKVQPKAITQEEFVKKNSNAEFNSSEIPKSDDRFVLTRISTNYGSLYHLIDTQTKVEYISPANSSFTKLEKAP